MQQQHRWRWHPSVSDSVSIVSSEITTTLTAAAAAVTTINAVTTTTTTTTADGGMLQLCSADSRLADQCLLVDTDLIWTPSISLSSADIASCLQTSNESSQATVGPAAGDDTDRCALTDTRQSCCTGYGVGEIIPSSADKYAVHTAVYCFAVHCDIGQK